MPDLMLFTDGSVDPESSIGFGAYLIVANAEASLDELRMNVVVQCFEYTSSTRLELQILLWALSDEKFSNTDIQLGIYTDSQNTIRLPERRTRLEKNNYYSRAGKRLKNHELYQQFYQRIDQLNCRFFKVHGHQANRTKNDMDQLFTLVDQASREAMRKFTKRSDKKSIGA